MRRPCMRCTRERLSCVSSRLIRTACNTYARRRRSRVYRVHTDHGVWCGQVTTPTESYSQESSAALYEESPGARSRLRGLLVPVHRAHVQQRCRDVRADDPSAPPPPLAVPGGYTSALCSPLACALPSPGSAPTRVRSRVWGVYPGLRRVWSPGETRWTAHRRTR